MYARLRESILLTLLSFVFLVGVAQAYSFDDKNSEFWVRQSFLVFDRFFIDIAYPPTAWEGRYTKLALSKDDAKSNNTLISLSYDYDKEKRVMPRSHLSVGVSSTNAYMSPDAAVTINGRRWFRTQFDSQSSGVIWKTRLDESYAFYVTLTFDRKDSDDDSFRTPRVEVLSRIIDSAIIEDKSEILRIQSE